VSKSTIDKKPLKIKASSYGKDTVAISQRNQTVAAPAKLNVKF